MDVTNHDKFPWNDPFIQQSEVDFQQSKTNLKSRYRSLGMTKSFQDEEYQVAEVMIGFCNKALEACLLGEPEYWGFSNWMIKRDLLALRRPGGADTGSSAPSC